MRTAGFALGVGALAAVWLATRTSASGAPGPRRHRGEPAAGAHWAKGRHLRSLVVRAPVAGRLTLGTIGGRLAVGSRLVVGGRLAAGSRLAVGGRLVAADAGHSLMVLGPTQSFKTTGLAVPALLEWHGPVVAASVKGDLVHDTVAWRRRQGSVWVYDPTGSSGREPARWSPLTAADSWTGARRVAEGLVEAGRTSTGGLTDGDFWYATAAKLLGPLLLAAAVSGRTMADVVRWVDEQETDEVLGALDAAGEWQAVQALQATWNRDQRQRSAVYTTAETVVEVFADPAVADSARPGTGEIDPDALLGGNNTLYLCAPAHEQRRLRPLFAGLVTRVIEAAYDRAARDRHPLDPPLLIVIDEAANVAPLAELDVLASTAAGHGIQLVTVWQDLAQLSARYGARAGTVVNNHRAKLFLSGIADPATLDHASQLIGECEQPVASTTVDRGRTAASTTTTSTYRRLAPADALRRMPPGTGVLISGHLPPVRITLRPWYRDGGLRRRSEGRA